MGKVIPIADADAAPPFARAAEAFLLAHAARPPGHRGPQ
jgi:hypothetical protein